MENCIGPEELDVCVLGVRCFDVIDVGGDSWIESHQNILRLSRQAALEALNCREELVKELMVANDKLGALIHEAYCILVWRTKVLPLLLEMGGQPNATFVLYTVLYHEAASVALLELCLYHESGCAAIDDHAMDLVDYCAQALTQLIGLAHSDYLQRPLDVKALADETPKDEIRRQLTDLQYKTGMRCLTILSSIADNVGRLSLGVVRRMVQTHDIPCILSEILHCQPWQRHSSGIEKYIDDKWTSVDGDDVLKLTKAEAHTWFCLRHLLFSDDAMNMYAINEFRQREISKCQMFLGESVLDQLPPLVDLKRRLCTLGLTEGGGGRARIILEEMPKMKDALVARAKKAGFAEIARAHAARFLNLNDDSVRSWALKLNDIYSLDIFE